MDPRNHIEFFLPIRRASSGNFVDLPVSSTQCFLSNTSTEIWRKHMSTRKKPSNAEVMAKFIGDNFIEKGKYFRLAQDYDPEEFAQIAKLGGVSLRCAYHFAKIDRAFGDLAIDQGRLLGIGWTKLAVIADHVSTSNYEQLLELAETSTVRELARIVQSKLPVPGERCILLYLKPGQFAVFEKAILANGGKKAGKGLARKEAALIKALTSTGS